jgi:hypothetical protein
LGGFGSGNALVAGFSPPNMVVAVANSSSVDLTWSAAATPGPGSLGYYVERFVDTNAYSTPAVAGGSCASSRNALLPASAQTCKDSPLLPGNYRYRVTAVFQTWSAQSGLSNTATISVIDHFVVSAATVSTAGTPFTVTITAKDASNSTITGYTGTVAFSSTDIAATLPSSYAFTTADGGTHTFSAAASAFIDRTAGSQQLSASDVAMTSAQGRTTTVVNPAPLDHFVVITPGSTSVGSSFKTTTVSARDPYGNPADSWVSSSHCVTFSGPANAPDGTSPAYPPAAGCPAGDSSLTFNGTGTANGFDITLFKAGSTTLTVSAVGKSGTSGPFDVVAGTSAGVVFTAASNRNGPVTVSCSGAVAASSCVPSMFNGSGRGRFFAASVSLVDQYFNVSTNTTSTVITITLTLVGGSLITPTSLTISPQRTTSDANFTATLANGSSSISISATVNSGSTVLTTTLTTT